MKRLLAAFFCTILAGLPALAQTPPAKPSAATPAGAGRWNGQLSPEPAQFIADVQAMLLPTNNANAKAVGEQLRQLWGSNSLTSSQQILIAKLSQQMLDKKLKPMPHLTTFFGAVVAGKTKTKLSDTQTDQFLAVLSESLAKDTPTDLGNYLQTSARLLASGNTLYKATSNSLRFSGGQLAFSYKAAAAADSNLDFGAPAPAEPVPVKAAPAATKAPAPKPAVKKPAVKKKRASDGWDTADLWSKPASKNDGWGSAADSWNTATPKKTAAKSSGWDDGWGAPAPKKTVAKPIAKAPAKAAPKPVAATKPATPVPTKSDFDDANAPFVPSQSAAYDTYYAPPQNGAIIELKDVDLVIGTPGDSMIIRKVSGTLSTANNHLNAKGGQMAWTIKGNPVTADLAGFDFDATKPEFTAQPVTLTYPYLLEAPVKGALSYKSSRRKAGAEDNGYPRFISLTNDAKVKNLGPGIDYVGGLSLAGGRMLSAALDGSASRLTVTQEGKLRFRASSTSYTFGDSLITAARAAVALFQTTGDSITHPGVEMKYTKGKQQLKLLYEKGTFRTTSYSDSYHQMDIRAQMLVWNLREPTMEFSIITSPTQVSADVESKGFFSDVRYQRLKSINRLHPLQMLLGYSLDHDHASVMSVHDVAEANHIPDADLQSTLTGLASQGYVEVRPRTGEVVLLRKARLYVGAARLKKDYDNINLKSVTGSGRSATLNMQNNQLVLRGVKQFNFANDTAAIAIVVVPDSQIVRIQKNRNMLFSGRVKTSLYSFKGHEFQFDYDGYYIDMPHIDSLAIRSKTKKKTGKAADTERRPADFALTKKGQTQSGRLLLNDPKNRSGRERMPKYPAFNSTSGATVYFGKADVLGGAYDSTTYFEVPPFKLDSMGSTKGQSRFTGIFHSKALPPITTAMTNQDDGALGFVHTVPTSGYDMYGKKGKLSGGATVKLNGGGLQTNGTVTYLGATMQSDKFVLYGDSLTGVGKVGSIAPGANTPKVTLPPGYLINWVAAHDSLQLHSPANGTAIKLYADHNFKGSLLLTPTKLGGAGRLDGPQSYVRSEDLTFKNDVYTGRKALLSVKSAQAGKAALTAPDVDLTYDLKNGNATFKRDPESKARIDLPYTGFQTSLAAGSWDFKKKRVTFETGGTGAAPATFTSTLAEQKGLKFQTKAATYDLTKYQLQAKGVPYIAVADSWVVPDSGRVTVAGGGKVQTLHRARLLLDSLNRYHRLFNGNIDVTSRTSFSGDADYRTVGPAGDSIALKFNNFKADSASVLASGGGRRLFGKRKAEAPATGLATVATAVMERTTKYQLAPRIAFQGGIGLSSKRRGLISDGLALLQFGKTPGPANALQFAVRDSIDPKNVVLDMTHLRSEAGDPLYLGLFVSDATNKIYPLYAGAKTAETDIPLLNVTGLLHYDSKTSDYTVGSDDPAVATSPYDGTQLIYHDATQSLNFRGPLNFIANNKNFGVVASGIGRAQPDSARYQMHALLGLDMELPGKSLDALASTLAAATKNSPQAISGTPEELATIGALAGGKAVTAFGNHGPGQAPPALASLSPKLQHTLTLSSVNLRWSTLHKAWYSVGKLGLATVGKQNLNALLDGHVEIKHENATDVVEVYLEPDPGTWVYFRYANNVLLTKSSDDKYDGEITKKQKGSLETATSYGVFDGEYDDVDRFRSNFQKQYLGKSGKLAVRPERPAPAPEVEKKKKGKDEAVASGEPGTEPAADPGKKKKKAKDTDPFGDGVINAPPTEEAPQKSKKELAQEEKEKAKEAKEAEKQKAQEAKEAAKAAQPDPTAEPTTEPDKKSKKKKKESDDPFGN